MAEHGRIQDGESESPLASLKNLRSKPSGRNLLGKRVLKFNQFD